MVGTWKEIIYCLRFFISSCWLIFIIKFLSAVCACITFLGPVRFLHHVYGVLFTPWTLVDGCVCTAVTASVSFLCIYFDAVDVYNVQHIDVRHASQSLSISWNYEEFTHLLFSIVFYFYLTNMPNCVAIILWCVFNWMFLSLVATNCSFVVLGNNLLYMYKGIMFPSLPVSTLYGIIIEIWFDDVFRFAVFTNHLLLKIIEFMFTVQYDLLLHTVGLLPVLGHGWFYFSHYL